jgi:hypothetical protein
VDYRGRDPIGHNQGVGGIEGMVPRTSRSTSTNILEELQNIEHALSMVSSHSTLQSPDYNTKSQTVVPTRSKQQDWAATATPPRPVGHANKNPSTNTYNGGQDPPLNNTHQPEFYAKRFENHSNGNKKNIMTNPRSPLVRFAEQLEVYSKHISQGCNTPTIPILRSKSSGSFSKKSISNSNSTVLEMNHPSGGSRDPTPRASIGEIDEGHCIQQRREPAGMSTSVPKTSCVAPHSGKVMSDPPVDRSRRFLVSPSANIGRPSFSQDTAKYQVRPGAFSLHENVNSSYNMTSILGNNTRGNTTRSTSDMELNPKRLSSQFQAVADKKIHLPRQDLAPTPTHREQAPTPNNERSLSQKQSVNPSPKVWNPTSLFSNPCQSPFPETQPRDVVPIPSASIHKSNGSSSIPPVLNVPMVASRSTSPMISSPRYTTSTVDTLENQGVQVDDTSHAESTSSAESSSALLIGNHYQGTKDRWEKGPDLRSSISCNGDDNSLFSEGTPPKTSKIFEGNVSLSDSKLYYKARMKKTKYVKGSQSYLQLGDEGSILQSNVGTEIMALPNSIEVRVEESVSMEDSHGEQQTKNSDYSEGAFHRIRSKAGLLQEVDGDFFSHNDELGGSLHDEYSLIKKATSETDETDSGIHAPVAISRWDMFERNADSDCEDDAILIPSFKQRRRRIKKNKTWIIWILLCTVVICLAAGLPLYFLMMRQQRESLYDDVFFAETEAPSFLPQQLDAMDFDTCILLHGDQAVDYSDRYDAIRQNLRLMSVGRTAMIDEPESPQRKALCWLAVDDAYRIDINNKNTGAIVQRYSLAVIYFLLASSGLASGENLAQSNFLSDEQECDWDAVMCIEPGIVSALLLSDKDLSGTLPAEIGNLVGLCKYLSGGRDRSLAC